MKSASRRKIARSKLIKNPEAYAAAVDARKRQLASFGIKPSNLPRELRKIAGGKRPSISLPKLKFMES